MSPLGRLTNLFKGGDADCRQVRESSSDYLEADLPSSKLGRIRAHLSGCPPCQSFVDSLASVVGMLTKLPDTQTPSALKQSILDSVRNEEEGRGDKSTT